MLEADLAVEYSRRGLGEDAGGVRVMIDAMLAWSNRGRTWRRVLVIALAVFVGHKIADVLYWLGAIAVEKACQ